MPSTLEPSTTPENAFAACETLATSHYENFTFLSGSLPKPLRPHMAALYSYCRCVDDIGDEAEGDRLALLDDWERALNDCFDGKATIFPFTALKDTVKKHTIEKEQFERLIEANRRDQSIGRYEDYASVIDYCRYSATPVGRMVLQLFGCRGDEYYSPSDATCTALQLANFWQDVSRDIDKDRIYIPRSDRDRFGVPEQEILDRTSSDAFNQLMKFECQRTWNLFHEGWDLIGRVPKPFRYLLALFTFGGVRVLERIRDQRYDTLAGRPALTKMDRVRVFWRAKKGAWFGANSIPTFPEVSGWA
jgi:squalene synthase HpnC